MRRPNTTKPESPDSLKVIGQRSLLASLILTLRARFVTPHARKSFGQMSDDQKLKLDAIQFEFDVPDELKGPPPVDWDAAFEALAAYHKRHGDTKVPEKTTFGDLNQVWGGGILRRGLPGLFSRCCLQTQLKPKTRPEFTEGL